MSSEKKIEINKENIDIYLKAVAKEYRRLVGKNMPAEFILIGGAAVLINYGFRDMTSDIDVLIHSASAMKDAINNVGNRFNLPFDWLNEDFKKTKSYSKKLIQYSVYYRTYSNVISIRSVSAEYLIAMKLMSGRTYKNDLSDILGILEEHRERGNPISVEMIAKAVTDLYGKWSDLPEASQIFIENVMKDGRYEYLYKVVSSGEKETKKLLIQFEDKYPDVMASDNINDIMVSLQRKSDKASIIMKLREMNKGDIKSDKSENTPKPNKTTEAAMKETQDILDGKKQAKTYTSAEEMLEDIENKKDDQDN